MAYGRVWAAERMLFGHGTGQVWTVDGNTAGKNEFLDDRGFAIGFGDGLHDPRRSRHVNLPHAVEVKDAGAYRIKHKCQMDNSRRPRIPQQKKSWRQDSSSPRSMRSKRSGRSVLGGAKSTPITSNSASCGSRRVPRLPEIPVTTTVGFGSPIYLGPDSGALADGALVPAAASARMERPPERPRNTYRSTQVWRISESPAWRPECAANAMWRQFHRALCRAAECLFLRLCKSGIRSEWRSAARSRRVSGPSLRPGWEAGWCGEPCQAGWEAFL